MRCPPVLPKQGRMTSTLEHYPQAPDASEVAADQACLQVQTQTFMHVVGISIDNMRFAKHQAESAQQLLALQAKSPEIQRMTGPYM